MIASPQFNYLSHTEYLHLEEQSDLKHEYIDGEVYAMAGASDRQLLLVNYLQYLGATYAALAVESICPI